jgi:hypothetical protein
MSKIVILKNRLEYTKAPDFKIQQADLVAYGRDDGNFSVVKDRSALILNSYVTPGELVTMFEKIEKICETLRKENSRV